SQRLPVWASPPTGGGRIGFPETHPAFQGVLPPAVAPLAQALEGYDLVLVAGSSVFPYYPNIPGDFLPAGELPSGGEVHKVLAELFPTDGIVVLESPSSTAALRSRLRLDRPGSYYF